MAAREARVRAAEGGGARVVGGRRGVRGGLTVIRDAGHRCAPIARALKFTVESAATLFGKMLINHLYYIE